ncbi:hypothetical protein ACEPPZ_14035 [Paracoccus yeei]|uniref:hypothetical protein n=1 Tax=Paracoccus yeei TaxID=147645 RepID=UPI0028D436D1|nr:hypothetical protein [Paracoccus yeei]
MRRLLPCLPLLLSLAACVSSAPPPQPAPPPLAPGALRVMMCEIRDESGTGWVPSFLMLTRQTAGPHSGRIEVFDPILQNLVGRPVAAQVTVDDGASRSYGWALSGVRNGSGQYAARLDYRLTVSKSDGAAQVTAVAEGYDNIMHGQGRCLSPAEG